MQGRASKIERPRPYYSDFGQHINMSSTYESWYPPPISELAEHSINYNVIRRKRALKKELRAIGILSDLIKLIIEYTHPSSDILNRIQYNKFEFDYIDKNMYQTQIQIQTRLDSERIVCNNCYSSHFHICMVWTYSDCFGNYHYNGAELYLDSILSTLYTGDVKQLIVLMIREYPDCSDDEEIFENYADNQNHIATLAAQEYIDSLIW